MSLSHLNNLKGLLPSRSDQWQNDYQFTEEADVETVRVLPGCVYNGYELSFSDADHPPTSDPGAYITLARASEGFVAMCAHHGWSSD